MVTPLHSLTPKHLSNEKNHLDICYRTYGICVSLTVKRQFFSFPSIVTKNHSCLYSHLGPPLNVLYIRIHLLFNARHQCHLIICCPECQNRTYDSILPVILRWGILDNLYILSIDSILHLNKQVNQSQDVDGSILLKCFSFQLTVCPVCNFDATIVSNILPLS